MYYIYSIYLLEGTQFHPQELQCWAVWIQNISITAASCFGQHCSEVILKLKHHGLILFLGFYMTIHHGTITGGYLGQLILTPSRFSYFPLCNLSFIFDLSVAMRMCEFVLSPYRGAVSVS